MSGSNDHEEEPSHEASSADGTAHDRAIRTALRGAEVEEGLKSVGRGSSDECGPDSGSGDQNKNEGQSSQETKASKRLMEEVEYEEG